MKTQLRTRFLNDATISGLIATRMDWGARPQGKPLPAGTLNVIVDRREQHMGGLQATRGTWVQIDFFAEGAPAEALATLGSLIEAAVELLATPAVVDGVTFLGAADITDRSVPAISTGTNPVYQAQVEAIIWHTVIP